MKSVKTMIAFSFAMFSLSAMAQGSWECIAKSTLGVHPATVVWSDFEPTRQAAQDSAMSKCRFEAAAPMNCHITDCWIHYK